MRLLHFPCVVAGAPAHVYGGHCSHVMNVRWAADESYAVRGRGGGKESGREVREGRTRSTPARF